MKKPSAPAPVSNSTTSLNPLLENYPTSNFSFESGLYGFEKIKHLKFFRYQATPFYLLEATEEATLKFTLLAPHPFFPDYHLALEKKELAEFEEKHTKIFLIVTFGKEIKDTTVNLLGPILLNFQSKTGKQVIAQDPNFTTKHYLWK